MTERSILLPRRSFLKSTAALGLAVGFQGVGGIGAAAGAGVAVNDIGNTVLAQIDSSTVDAGGDIDLSASSRGTIQALATGVSASVSSAALAGAGAGAGAGTDNEIHSTIQSEISRSNRPTACSFTRNYAATISAWGCLRGRVRHLSQVRSKDKATFRTAVFFCPFPA